MLLFSGISWVEFIVFLLVFLSGYYLGVFVSQKNISHFFISKKKSKEGSTKEKEVEEEESLTINKDYSTPPSEL